MVLFGSKNKSKNVNIPVPLAGVRDNANLPTTISGHKTRNVNLLDSLRSEMDVYRAIELITEQHPDASQSVQSYIRLANSGHNMEIYTINGERNPDAESWWNEYASKPIDYNAKGFDGLIDQVHDSLIRFGGVGAEIVVTPRANNIGGMHLILPQWITWEQDGYGGWKAFQQQGLQKVELSESNFFWVALDNKVGQPVGKLQMESALLPLERQLQFFEDISAVLRRVGYPRNDISIDREAVIKGFPASVQKDPKALKKSLTEYFDFVQGLFQRLGPLDDYIHFDDLKINKSQGENSRTIDARSYLEIIDPQVINGLGTMSILLNRTTGITETWGTVQLKIIIDTLENVRQCSKRLAEYACRIGMRVNGIQGTCKFTHKPVDWESELKRLEVVAKKQEIERRNEEYGWKDKPTAAKDGVNVTDIPTAPPDGRTAYITKDFGSKTKGTEE